MHFDKMDNVKYTVPYSRMSFELFSFHAFLYSGPRWRVTEVLVVIIDISCILYSENGKQHA